MEKKENFKISCISFLYHLEVNQYKLIWLVLIGSFHQYFSDLISPWSNYVKNRNLSAKGDFSNILVHHLHISACKTRIIDNWKTWPHFGKRKDWAITFIRINKRCGGWIPYILKSLKRPKEITRGRTSKITIHCWV